jgi:hypothetical protein
MSSEWGPDDGQNERAARRIHEAFQAGLAELTTTEYGLGFIYSALALLAEKYGLNDVVLVLKNETGGAGTQIFRLNGKIIDSDFVLRFGDVPGLYCKPREVALADRDALLDACKRALPHPQSRVVATRESDEDALESSSDSDRFRSPRYLRASRFGEVLAKPVSDSETSAQSYRAFLSRVLVAVDLANIVMTLIGAHGPIRFTFGLILGLFIPGWSVIGSLKLRNFALEFCLSMASSLAIILIAAQTMTLLNFWHLGAFEVFVCCVCLIPLVRLSDYQPFQNRGAL